MTKTKSHAAHAKNQVQSTIDQAIADAEKAMQQVDDLASKWSRKDENGEACPGTLGEYIDIVTLIAPGSKAVQYLDQKINESPNGRDEKVVAPDSQMRALLQPLAMEDAVTDAAAAQ